jgi:hypothetical protein
MKIINLKARAAKYGVPKGWELSEDHTELVRIPYGVDGFRPEGDGATARDFEQYYTNLEQQQPIDPEEFHQNWTVDKNNSSQQH